MAGLPREDRRGPPAKHSGPPLFQDAASPRGVPGGFCVPAIGPKRLQPLVLKGVVCMEANAEQVGTSSSSLDASETIDHPLMRQSHVQRLIHRPHQSARERICTALHNSDCGVQRKHAGKMGMCCVSPQVWLREHGRPQLHAGRCRVRLCPHCAKVRGQQVRERVQAAVLRADSLRFVTLTQRAETRSLGESVDALQRAWRDLRKSRLWRSTQRAALWVVEVKRNVTAGTWHVHMHVLADGTYVQQSLLQSVWSEIYGELAIVDIRAVHQRSAAVRYVTKYVAKGSDVGEWDAETIREFAAGVHRRRLYGTCGRWHKLVIDRVEAEERKPHGVTKALSVVMLRELMVSETISRERALPIVASLGRVWRLCVQDLLADEQTAAEPVCEAEVAWLVGELLRVASRGDFDPDAPPPKPKPPPEVQLEMYPRYMV